MNPSKILTSSNQFNTILSGGWEMSNDGRIYPRGKCPLCGQAYQLIDNDLICPIHLTRRKYWQRD